MMTTIKYTVKSRSRDKPSTNSKAVMSLAHFQGTTACLAATYTVPA